MTSEGCSAGATPCCRDTRAARRGEAILGAVTLVKARNPAAVYCCDPVIGDVGRGTFVQPGIPELIRDRVLPAAQIITPNAYELEVLTGRKTSDLESVLAAAEAARECGPEIVLVTSVQASVAVADTIDMVLLTADGAWSVTTPALPQAFDGAGDLTAALFLAQLLDSGDAPDALARTAGSVFGVLAATAAAVSGSCSLSRPRRSSSARAGRSARSGSAEARAPFSRPRAIAL